MLTQVITKGRKKIKNPTCPQCGSAPHITLSKLKRSDYRCLPCQRQAQNKWRANNDEHIKKYEANRIREPVRLKNPTKYKARWMLNNEVRSGRIKKEPCVFCKELKVEAHHKDYSMPLVVVWLCHRCHSIAHSQGML